MEEQPGIVVRRSFAPWTVAMIRFGSCHERESNQQRLQRMERTFDLSPQECKLIVGVGDAFIDTYGRIKE